MAAWGRRRRGERRCTRARRNLANAASLSTLQQPPPTKREANNGDQRGDPRPTSDPLAIREEKPAASADGAHPTPQIRRSAAAADARMTNRRGRPWKVNIDVIQRDEPYSGLAQSRSENATAASATPTQPLPFLASSSAPLAEARSDGAQICGDDPTQSTDFNAAKLSDRVATSDLSSDSGRRFESAGGAAAKSHLAAPIESSNAGPSLASTPGSVPIEAAPASTPRRVVIGVLALQGAFIEHIAYLDRLAPMLRSARGIEMHSRLVRTAAELGECDGLILPGGESTAMRRLLAEGDSDTPHGATLLSALQSWVRLDKPVFGTCAGSIMLADRIVACPPDVSRSPSFPQGSETIRHSPPDSRDAAPPSASTLVLPPVAADHTTVPSSLSALGGIDITLARNYFGRQLASFQTNEITLTDTEVRGAISNLQDSATATKDRADERCPGVFIRAPAILQLGPSVRVLATLPHADTHRRRAQMPALDATAAASSAVSDQAVAVRSGRRIATSFHPELTTDLRWHAYFVDIVLQARSDAQQR